MAGHLQRLGVGKGNVAMTLMGTRPEWILTLLACFRIGAVALPCVAQSRPKDLALRASIATPSLVVATEATEGAAAAAADCPLLVLPDELAETAEPAPACELTPDDPAMMIFTSGTSGSPKAVVHGVRYLFGQAVQAQHWLGVKPGDRAWCTAAAGWSKSARNSFIAPWLVGAEALVHDGRFDPQQRIDLIKQERVNVLSMAPTEYRMVLRRGQPTHLPDLRSAVAASSSARSSCSPTATPPSPALAHALQAHVKSETAPYKYPRVVDFVAELPRTASGKVRRAALRETPR